MDYLCDINDLHSVSVLIDRESYENVLIFDVTYKTLYHTKLLHIVFDKVDGHVRKYEK